MKIRVLLVETDPEVRTLVRESMAEEYDVVTVRSGEEAIELLTREVFEIVVLALNLPGMSGLELLQHCPRLRPGIISVVMTSNATIETAVEAMKRGATEFLMKPVAPQDLLSALSVASERVFRHALTSNTGMAPVDIVAQSQEMKSLLAQASSVASFNSTVLITGETGTGKELVARSIHQNSPRRNRPLVALNCAAIPEHLLEDELFGHVKGAFTGALNARVGRFEQADGGTLFLDEIGDMSLPLQAKLLRVLQEREFERLGSSRTTKVDVRIVAATSANLANRVREGSFREDLYYRLNVVHLRLPALRARKQDIEPLANQLLARFCSSAGLPLKTLGHEVREALYSYYWPGNVRQLQNAMERAAALSGSRMEIQLYDLPEEVREAAPELALSGFSLSPSELPSSIPDEGLSYETVVATVERDLLLKSLKKTGGNKVRAAKLLQMKRTTFAEKLKRLQMTPEEDLMDDLHEYQAS